MDAALDVAGLADLVSALVTEGDFEGAEAVLSKGLEGMAKHEAFVHFQFGQLYYKWNKMTSATNHLIKAAELAKLRGDEIFVIQVVSELKRVREAQASQRP